MGTVCAPTFKALQQIATECSLNTKWQHSSSLILDYAITEWFLVILEEILECQWGHSLHNSHVMSVQVLKFKQLSL